MSTIVFQSMVGVFQFNSFVYSNKFDTTDNVGILHGKYLFMQRVYDFEASSAKNYEWKF